MKMNRKLSINKITPALLLLPGLIGQCIFIFTPFLDILRRSFFNSGKLFCGLGNYIDILKNQSFQIAVENTLLYLFAALFFVQIIALPLAYILFYLKDLGNLLLLIGMFPLAVPASSVALFWSALFSSKGFLNGFLNQLSIPEMDWLNSGWGLLVLVILYIWKNGGFIALLWSIGLKSIPQYVYEAAKIDGADKKRIFLAIILPNMKTTLYTTTIFSLANAFKIYREAYLLMGEYPSEHTYLLQHIFNNWFRNNDFNKLAAGSVLYGLFVIVLMMLLFKFNRLDE